jgi:hypothetical protein
VNAAPQGSSNNLAILTWRTVDVTGFNDKTWLAGVGTVHSEELHVTERHTRGGYDMINYGVTMEA